VTLINCLLKPKCMLIHIFEIFFVIWKYNMIFFYFIFERLGRMHENKIFFLFYFYFFVLPKTGYFNTKLVSLQYKNTNQCWLKYSRKKKQNITDFLKHFYFLFLFYFNFFFGVRPSPAHVAGLDPANLRSWAGPDQPIPPHARVIFYACMNSAKVI